MRSYLSPFSAAEIRRIAISPLRDKRKKSAASKLNETTAFGDLQDLFQFSNFCPSDTAVRSKISLRAASRERKEINVIIVTFFSVRISLADARAKLRSHPPSLCDHSRSPTLRAPPRSCPTVSARKLDCSASDRNSDSSSRRSKRIRAREAVRVTTAAAPLSLSETSAVDRETEASPFASKIAGGQGVVRKKGGKRNDKNHTLRD